MAKINYTESLLKILLAGVSQGTISGPVLFNILLNDLFMFTKEAKIANSNDDNKICTESKDIAILLKSLEQKSEKGIELLKKMK